MKTHGSLMILMLVIGLLMSWEAPAVCAQFVQSLSVTVTNYPNPFDSRNGRTTICYSLTQDSQVRVAIYDLLGNLVKQYPSVEQAAGTASIVWDGTNEASEKVARGGYLVLIVARSASGITQAIRKIGVLH